MKRKGLALILSAVMLQMILGRAHSQTRTDTNSVIELNLKAWEVKENDLELSKKYAAEAMRIAEGLNYQRGLSYSYNIYGHYYKEKGLYDSSLFVYNKSLMIRKKLRDTLNIARSYRNLAALEERLGTLKRAIHIGQLGLQLLEKKHSDLLMLGEKAWMKTTLGGAYIRAGDFKQAIPLLRDAKELFMKLENEQGLAATCTNLGLIYQDQKLYLKALAEYMIAAPIFIESDNQAELAKVYNNMGNVYYHTFKFNEALSYYRKSLEIREEHGLANDLAGSHLNMGVVYEALNNVDSATWYYREALDLSRRYRNREVSYESHRALGTLLYDLKNFEGARRHLLSALDLSLGVGRTAENSILLRELSNTYRVLGNRDSALFFSDKYAKVTDSLNKALISSIGLQLSLDEKESQLKLSKYDLALSNEKNKQQNMLIIGLIAACLFVLIIFFLYYRFMRSKSNVQELRELVKDKELKAMDAMLEGQQEERKRLATELHDTIGSMLSATKYSFKAMEKSMEKMVEENKGQYQKINSMLDQTMDSVRRISHDMAAGVFTEKGLEGALAELCETFEHPGKMRIHLNVYGFNERLDSDVEKHIYQIVRELLANIIKHANAHEVTIQLIKSNENINLTVEDDGLGFDPAEAKKKKGMGLSNIEMRVKKVSGRWNIDSGKGKGTTVIIDIPIVKTA